MKFGVSIIVVRFLSVFGVCFSQDIQESLPKVNTVLGSIEGYYKTSGNGRLYEAYEGIPYAQPPIGELRFRAPRPIPPWSGVMMAKKFSLPCLQYNQYPIDPDHQVEGSEDCLYLNVYTALRNVNKNDSESRLKPVIFFIHGGSFQYGSGMSYGPKYLLDKNIAMVTLNYRVGPLGFLSTQDETVSGNMGLKDQAIALRWVKDNIESFGGDPSKITIFGHSAGGASVHYHYLSNLTAGLFHGGMSLSGTALDCWARTENSLEKAIKLGTIVGCPTENVPTMVECLRTRPGHQIVEAVEKFLLWQYNPFTPFGPVVEKGGGEMTFLDREPVEIITSGEARDVPWITGVTSEEGLYPAAHFVTSEELLKEVNDNWETIAPYLLDFYSTIPKIAHPKIAKLIKDHYLGTRPIDKSTVNQTIKMFSDRIFVYDALLATKLQARANQSPVRFYYFSYRGAQSTSEVMCGSKENFGVSHEDDILYVTDAFLDPTTTPNDREMQKILINLWVSFADEGTPDVGVEWPAVSRVTDEFSYLDIAGPDKISTKESTPDLGEMNFWPTVGFRENLLNNNSTIL